MTFLALPWWLVLYCHVHGQIATTVEVNDTGRYRHAKSEPRHDRSESRTFSSKSTCQRLLGSFVSCYDVVPPLFTANLFNVTYRRVQPQPSLTFSALGRRFSLRLQRDDYNLGLHWSSVLAPSAVVQVVDRHGIHRVYTRTQLDIVWYVGHDSLEVAPSLVFASVVHHNDQRLFRAIIHTTSDVYYIEPAADHSTVRADDMNASVVYRLSDVPRLLAPLPHKTKMCQKASVSRVGRPQDDISSRRGPHGGPNLTHGATCGLGVVIDHTFYRSIARSSPHVAVSLVTQHVVLADFVFRNADMVYLDALPDNIGFSIVGVKIYESPSAPNYRFSDISFNAWETLEAFSRHDFDDFCLAVAFTHRDLLKDVIGIAWLADVKMKSGICSRHEYKTIPMIGMDYYSQNTVVVSQLQGSKRLVDAVVSVTLIHELGHSFGAEHDEVEFDVYAL